MSDWIEWNGGECPVQDGDLLDVQCRVVVNCDELISEHFRVKNTAGARWTHTGKTGDILAYRRHDSATA